MGIPMYQQLYQRIKGEIQSGVLPARTRLLSKRRMAEQLGVSVNTVEGAYGQLLSEGFIEARPKSGYYVCEIEDLIGQIPAVRTPPQPAEPVGEPGIRVDFAITGVDREGFPYSTWRRIARAVFDECDPQLLARSPFQGEAALRRAIASYLSLSRGVHCAPEQIVVGAGTDNLLQILSYILDNRCTIVMENPVYHESYLFFRRMGHPVTPIPIDEKGLPVEPLEALDNAAVYITPSHQFPLGITMPISRRIQLLNWANKAPGRYVIEDDYDSEFRYNSHPVPAMKSIDTGERVIYLGSFSRAIAPALRISYLVLPEALLADYSEGYAAFGCSVSKLDQLILTRFIENRHFETHLNRMRKTYKEKRAQLVGALREAFGGRIEIQGENAGQHVLVRLTDGTAEAEIVRRAQGAGVRVYPVSPYFMGELPEQYQGIVLLGYATLTEEEIQEGVARLRGAW